MNIPQPLRGVAERAEGGANMGKWVCGICGYIYDEEKEGVPFPALPENWVCPLCGAGKKLFSPMEASAAPKTVSPAAFVGKEGQLSAGALSAVCSNLARGCEKQYQEHEMVLFQQLADYFSSAASSDPEGSLGRLSEGVKGDLETAYPALSAAAAEAGDRGTQRICVWGEKVTRMQQALLDRYQQEGESFLENTQIWVCSVCGFLYVGDSAPELCPVCKVPAWKFERIEGRR